MYGFVIRREQVKTSIYIRSGDADATRDAVMAVPHMMEEINLYRMRKEGKRIGYTKSTRKWGKIHTYVRTI